MLFFSSLFWLNTKISEFGCGTMGSIQAEVQEIFSYLDLDGSGRQGQGQGFQTLSEKTAGFLGALGAASDLQKFTPR